MATLVSEQTTDFGQGMDDSSAATAFHRSAVRLLLNGRIEPDGTVTRRGGNRRLHWDALVEEGVGYGASWFRTAAGVDQIIAMFGGKAFVSEGPEYADWVQIADELRHDYYDFASMRVGASMYLFAANGDDTVKRWDGETWDTLPDYPAGVRFLEVFNSRLWFAGHHGILVQASRIADPETIASPFGLTVQAITHQGNDITGLYQLGSHLLVFDRQSTSLVDGFGESTIVVATGATGFSRSVGCVGFRTIAGVGDNAVCWLSERGVEHYAPGSGIQLLSRRVQRFLEQIDRSLIDEIPGRPSAAYDPTRQEYHLALSAAGSRNDRTLVINILQDRFVGRSGLRGACAIDRIGDGQSDLLFAGDAEGYLTISPQGAQLRAGLYGYVTLATEGQSGNATAGDEDGYLATVLNNALPATLFVAPAAGAGPILHSLGYDGFVRRHWGVDTDNADPDGAGGAEITMTVVSRPFHYGKPRSRKRVRSIHVAAISDTPATLTVRVRARGTVSASRQITIPATAFDQPRRQRVMVSTVSDVPQIEVHTSDPARIALIGASAEILREVA